MTPDEIAQKYGGQKAQGQQEIAAKYGGKLVPPPEMSWGEVGSEALSNIPSSGAAYVSDLWNAVVHPINTATTVIDLGAGALQAILPEDLVQAIGEDERSRTIARQFGEMLIQRYGTMEDVKRTVATDPVGFLGDVSSVFGIGSLATKGKLATGLKTVAAVTEPLTIATAAARKAAPYIGPMTSAVAGVTTGAGSKPFQEAYKAGREGGARAEQFRSNISGRVPQESVIDIAKNALDNIRQKRGRDYVEGMRQTGEAIETITFGGIQNAINKAMGRARFKDEITDQAAASAIQQVSEDVAKWSELDPAQYHNALGMDALKRKIGATLESLDPKSNAYASVKQIYDAVKSEIISQAPKYAETMKSYQEMSDLILEIERSLSLGNKAAADTTMRKLQSLMRDNVQTNYGQRVKLGELLESYGDQTMMPALAGQTLSDLAPRGIARAGAPALGVSALSTGNIPQLAATALFSSPRAMGEMAYGAGALARGAENLANRISPSLLDAITDPVFRNIMYQSQGNQ